MTASTAVHPSAAGMWGPMRHAHFRRFFVSALVSNAGTWMQSVAVPFAVFEITDSRTWLGVTAFIGLFVSMLANTPGGMLADRYPRRLVLAATQLLQMSAALALWALWVFGKPTIAAMIPLLVVSSIGGGLTLPAWQSLIPSLVAPHEMSAAIRLNSMQFAAARSIGPVIGAVTLKAFGPAVCFMANAVTYPVVVVVLLLLPDTSHRADRNGRQPLRLANVLADTAAGWRHMRSNSALSYAPRAVFVNAAVGFGVSTLAPALARDQFHHRANDNGLLIGAFGIGGVIAVIVIGTFVKGMPVSSQVRGAFTAWTLASVLLVVTHHFWVGLVAFTIAGGANTVGASSLNTSVQLSVDDAYRGRVMAIYMQMFFLGSALGSLALGILADVVSLEAVGAVCAVTFVCFHVWSVIRFDRLRVLDPPRATRVPSNAGR